MSTVTVVDEALVEQSAADARLYEFDWDTNNLAAAVTITSSTITATTLKPSTATALTLDNKSILAGSRTTQVRVSGGTAGARYRITNQVITNESPAQTKNKYFDLLVT